MKPTFNSNLQLKLSQETVQPEIEKINLSDESTPRSN